MDILKSIQMVFLIRDSHGIAIVGNEAPLERLLSAEHAELIECQAAMDFAMENRLAPVIIETDCLVVQLQLAKTFFCQYLFVRKIL